MRQARKSEVVIIGGGISGVAAAYELARRGAAPVLLEKGDLASMASGWTLGGVRQSGRHSAELPLAKAAVARWPSLGEEFGADTEYRQRGNLRLARNEEEAVQIKAVVESTAAAGIAIEYLQGADVIRAIAPALSETIHSASFCPGDGHANPQATVNAYAQAASGLGATICSSVEVTRIHTHGGAVAGVESSGGEFACDQIIVAAGIYTPVLLEPLGIPFPLSIRMVPVFQTIPQAPFLDQVLGVAAGNLAARQEVSGSLRLSGGSRPWTPGLASLEQSADSVQPTPADLNEVTQRAVQFLPRFDQLRIRRVWGGLIDQTPDGLPVYSNQMGIEGLTVAAGFSGHGFGIGPVTGEILAELMVHGKTSHDIEPFRLNRFAAMSGLAPAELHG
jgi:sarcosine oxidase, subunit beta